MQLQPIDLVRGDVELPTLSNIYLQFTQKLDEPGAKSEDFAEIIGTDPALTTKLLKIVNSAYYSFSATITDVTHAITIVGLTELREMVLAICVVDYFEGLPNDLVSMDDFWQHSILTGLLSREMQKTLKINSDESMFTIGLLHDLGSLVFYNRLPEIARSVIEVSQREQRPRFEVEQEKLGFQHAHIGACLLEHWGLPAVLMEIVKQHHSPEMCEDFYQQTLLLNLADKVARAKESGEIVEAMQLTQNQAYLPLRLSTDALSACLDRSNDQLQSVISAIQAV